MLGRIQPSNQTIAGIALILFGGVLLGVGMHHLVSTGTCSSTGYSANYGPVPHCPKGTGWWILFVMGGIFLCIIGGFLGAGATAGLIIVSIFSAIGAGSLTIAFDSAAKSSTKTFGAIFGGAFLAGGVIPALVMLWSGLTRLSRAPAPKAGSAFGTSASGASALAGDAASAFGGQAAEPDAILGKYAASAATRPPNASPPTIVPPTIAPLSVTAKAPAQDPIDKLQKLAQLREQGALTEDEFTREKAKLLGEI